MKQPTWKKWLSYFKDVHLESVESDFNPELQVFLVQGRYQLVTKNAVYSFDDLYTNFKAAFQQLNFKSKEIDSVLLLGLGLGSIPFMLEQTFKSKGNYTAVEIDDAIIYLANKYTLANFESPINYICTDAFSFVNTTREKYNLICMDIFEDDFIPPQFETIEYLERLKERLEPNGLLLYNRLSLTEEDLTRSQKFKDSKFLKVFPNGYPIEVKGNWILVGQK